MRLIDTVLPVRRLAVVGLAKNTGKTTALATLIPQFHARGERLGVTSLGRDGEAVDVLDRRTRKPAIPLPRDGFVATTETLLRASRVAHRVVTRTGHRTPLGQVVVAHLSEPGRVEVAGPSTGRGVREVGDAMLAQGSDRILVDGSINRRAAASPAAADGVVIATGAVLSPDPEVVVQRTREAIDLVRMPVLADLRARALGSAFSGSVLVTAAYQGVAINPQILLGGSASAVAGLFQTHRTARYLLIKGALCESFVEHVLRSRPADETTLVAEDCTKVFLSRRGDRWYAQRGVRIATMQAIRLCAITVNPVAPGSHHLPSLTRQVRAAIPDVPVFDVLGPDNG
jgi:hypothetical protein